MTATAQRNGRFSMDDYIDVAERISQFSERYPDGSLQTISWTVEHVDERTFIVYRAAAYRTPDDRRPGHGTAWEPFPGATPYTRDSELMNAETAAWGRAIVACGLASNRKIASRQEVRARQNGNGNGAEAPASQPSAAPAKQSDRPATVKQRQMLRSKASGLSAPAFANVIKVAAGDEAVTWADEAAAERWLDRALDRLPARLVDAVIAGIAHAAAEGSQA